MNNITYNHEYEKRVRVAAIGCGGHAYRNIFPAFAYAPVEFVAACDLETSRACDCARVFGARQAYTDVAEMLERERPELVTIVTSYDAEGLPRYPALAMQAMEAGAHAWIEKPPAGSVGEIERMMEVSRRTGKFAGVGFKKMFFPATQKTKEIITSADFGKVVSISCRYPQFYPPAGDRSDDRKMTWFLDHIVHPHSILQYLAGPVESLFVRRHENGNAIVALQFCSGAIGSLHLSHGQSGYSYLERTEVIGEGANVVIDNNIRVIYYRRGGPPGGYGRAGTYFGDDAHAPLVWEPEFSLGQLYNKGLFLLGYAGEIIDFCECILRGEKPAVAGLEDALEIMRVYEAYRQPDGAVVRVAR
jgi:predicted dehydrogenase